MVETWVATELRKLFATTALRTDVWLWRSRTGQEVDFLLERGNEIAGIEVKWSPGIQGRDLKGLRACAEALGKRWRFGILLHAGTEAVPLDDRTLAMPFGAFFGVQEES
jgi:predicted AAA+ superfamily ATPase